MKYSSFIAKALSPIKYVLKGLPNDYDINEIKDTLKATPITTTHLTQLKFLKADHKLIPIFFLNFENKLDLKI